MDQPTEKLGSDLVEFSTHSFIVKIWIEETAEEVTNPTWRGHITHVQSGSRRYLNSLNGMRSFIRPFLKSMGIKFDLRSHLRNQIKRWMHAQNGRSVANANLNRD